MEVITDMYDHWLFSTADGDDDDLLNANSMDNLKIKLDIFKCAIKIGNTQLIILHHKHYFKQLNGLAMGVANSLDLANLFLGITLESANEALHLLEETVKYENCVIEWVVSDSQCQFLDSTIYKGDDNQLKWKLYMKARNNREQIPWVSHHPIDVEHGIYTASIALMFHNPWKCRG